MYATYIVLQLPDVYNLLLDIDLWYFCRFIWCLTMSEYLKRCIIP